MFPSITILRQHADVGVAGPDEMMVVAVWMWVSQY